MALYPPIMASSQDAFLASSTMESIYFTLSNMTNIKDIGHIQIKIVYQSNNKSASTKYPDGIIYKEPSQIHSHGNGLYSIPIYSSDLTSGWIANKYYKVQICFGKSALWSGENNFADWKATQILENNNSEWSTVMVLKALANPEIKIVNQENLLSDYTDDPLGVESFISTELTTTPLFRGSFSCAGEPEDKFRFEIYQGDILLESSDWKQHNNSGGIDSYRFSHILTDFSTYKVTYQVITVNGYNSEIVEYEFMVNQNFLTKLEGIHLLVEDASNQEEPYADENGVLNIYLTTDANLSGNYVLTRSSEKSNFSVWEDLKFLVFSNHMAKKDLIYQDFTIESGIKYKYGFQQQNEAGLRTEPTYESETLEASPARMSNFQYSYLFADGVQLKLQFDNKITSFKHTVLESKQDTLGSKYPTINRNGDAYYAEFPISGLVSLHMDNDQTFFTLDDDNYYYKGEKVISADKHIIEGDINIYDHNLTNNNYFIEKIFRDKVEEFLNDGGCKLYKSPTEGNFIVTLMNVTFTPNETLGRLIFSFSATAYEILDNTLENLNEYNIIDIGEFSKNISEVDESGNLVNDILLGQISGLFGTQTNLVDIIKQDNEYDIGGGYQYHFERLASIQIEAYPQIDFTDKLNEYNVKYTQAKADNDIKTMSIIEQEIKKIQALQSSVNSQVAHPIITVYINGKEVSLGANRIYQLKDSEIISSIYLKYNEPVIINYTCYVSSKERETSTISSITTTSTWGQLAGVFTESESVLDNYILNRPSSLKVSDENNYSLYQSLDITDIIKEEVRHYIEQQYSTNFVYDAESGQWTDGKYYYIFQKFVSIEIEGDEGTILLITNKEDGAQQEVIIGATNKYKLENLSDLVVDIRLQIPSFLIVNYKCLTIQMAIGVS